jgi:Ca2+-binding EF-hand superfamily protein
MRCGAVIQLLLVLMVTLTLGGCGAQDTVGPTQEALRKLRIFSPNGEPLNGGKLGHPDCADAMGTWFDRVDTNHDGFIEMDEFLADAQRQFNAMDLNHDGVITPPELAQYRLPYGPAPAFAPIGEAMPQKPADDSDSRSKSGRGDIGNDTADPVMLADLRQRNEISLNDFTTYARRHFAELDRGHTGQLTKSEVDTECPVLRKSPYDVE